MLSFRQLSTLTAVLMAVLFLVLLFAPDIVFWLFSIETSESLRLLGRRTAMLFAGLAIVVWMLRHEPYGAAQQAVCAAFLTLMPGLAILGLLEFFRGAVGSGIMIAVAAEALIGISYTRLYLVSGNSESAHKASHLD